MPTEKQLNVGYCTLTKENRNSSTLHLPSNNAVSHLVQLLLTIVYTACNLCKSPERESACVRM